MLAKLIKAEWIISKQPFEPPFWILIKDVTSQAGWSGQSLAVVEWCSMLLLLNRYINCIDEVHESQSLEEKYKSTKYNAYQHMTSQSSCNF